MARAYQTIEFAQVRDRVAAGEQICIVEDSPDYPGHLMFQVLDDQPKFVVEHGQFLSRHCLLNELYLLDAFTEQLEDEGWEVVFLPSTAAILERHERWSRELTVHGLDLPDGLFPFQQYGLNRAIEASLGSRRKVDGFFFNFGTGTGKSILAAAGSQELAVNREHIDLVLVFSMRKMKINLARTVTRTTGLEAIVVDGEKARRRKQYASGARAMVLNYEKARVDFAELSGLIAGRRVLWVFDEVQYILRGDNDKNRSRSSIEDLMGKTSRSTVWPMSASVVKSSPLRYHDIFSLIRPTGNPLGTRKAFIAKYCEKVVEFDIRPGVKIRRYHWDMLALTEIRHLVSDLTQAVRKTDPGVKDFFQDMTTEVVYVQRTPAEERLYEAVVKDARERAEQEGRNFSMAAHYAVLRQICNTPASLGVPRAGVAGELAEGLGRLVETPSSKFEMICDKVAEIRDQGDQVVVFTQWTNLSLFLLADEFDRRGISYVRHYGTGQTDREAQAAQDRFKDDPDVTVFLSSDAGACGLDFTNARYVIHVECPYDPDLLMQRSDRIDRASSYLEGLTAYVYVCEGTVEERIWKINGERRLVSETTQGTIEALNRLREEDFAESLLSV